ncbi:MAG: hypoxanthine phosphoribosyltransferase [Candidatus Sumerlaeota bacterium]|nr:hypoxanthine phosphoribosyltransferase [Candidatus Sumerlaeota bacterium]
MVNAESNWPCPERRVARILFDEEQLAALVGDLARRIERDYASRAAPLVLIGVLKSCFHFLSDLSRRVRTPHEIDVIFAKSYRDAQSSGVVTITREPDIPLAGKDVLVVEDIYDTGRTLARVLEYLRGFKPASVEACVLFSKPQAHALPVDVKYIGAEIPNYFIVGYGLDYNEQYRDLPFVGIAKEAM